MFADDNSIDTLRQLFSECKVYLKLQKRYALLELTEKISMLLSGLILVLAGVILGMVVLFYLSLTLAFLLEETLGGLMASFALIAALNLLLIGLLYLFRRPLVINPTVKFISSLFTDTEDSPQA
ncbi:MAG: phage holin family protein [Bacteroides sp.]|nr:phage holin family protein [Bacteroides sp.]